MTESLSIQALTTGEIVGNINMSVIGGVALTSVELPYGANVAAYYDISTPMVGGVRCDSNGGN